MFLVLGHAEIVACCPRSTDSMTIVRLVAVADSAVLAARLPGDLIPLS